jgi:phosphomannomutase
VKCYLEVVVPVDDDPEGVDAARIAAAGRLDAIRVDVQKAAGL